MEIKKSKRRIDYIVVHCSATPEGRNHTVQEIKKWHLNRGFSDIGYNYVIQLNGTIEDGRDVDLIPIHVKGYNSNSIGICYVGGCEATPTLIKGKKVFKSKDTRTTEQKRSLEYLLKTLRILYPNAKILGHRDFPNVNKSCPSFDAKKEYSKL